jgi:hypothetical protein
MVNNISFYCEEISLFELGNIHQIVSFLMDFLFMNSIITSSNCDKTKYF